MTEFHSHDLAAVWLGHASVLVRMGGVGVGRGPGITALTDPVFSHRIGLRVGSRTFGMPRLCPLPIGVDDLPPIDLILLSHAHFDHLDQPTLERLASRRTTVVTARRTARLIPSGFGRVIELDWNAGLRIGGRHGARITAIRPRHWGARFACDRRRGFNSYLLERAGAAHGRVLFAGDTAMTDAFERIGAVDLAMFGIGAYEPWNHAHANPEEVWSMFRAVTCPASGRGSLLPIHHSTFELGEEHPDEPMERLLAAAGAEAHRIVGRSMGELWTPAARQRHGAAGRAEPPSGPAGVTAA